MTFAFVNLSRALMLLLASSAVIAPEHPTMTYGAAQPLGRGTVRAYVTVDASGAPLEVGVAFSERAMEGLPASKAKAAAKPQASHDHAASPTANPHGGHEEIDSHTLLLDLPGANPTPYTFVQLDWNPGGHEPPGVYDVPHFDFHFWTASKAVRESIVPGSPDFAKAAAAYPPEEYRMPFYVDLATAGKMPAEQASAPKMGMHWLDVRSPELQGMAGAPEKAQPFTKTFIYGSWDGRFVFAEPMITRAYIMSKRVATASEVRDEVVPVSVPAKAQVPGYHPSAYRIAYDATAKEYRVALTNFEKR